MQNFDELAEGYLGLVEKQKVSEGKAVDSFTRGDMETCYVSGAQSMEQLQVGCELDTEYFAKGCERFNRECLDQTTTASGRRVKQLSLFE